MKKIFAILLIGLIISCQSDWSTKNERIIGESEKNFKLVNKSDSVENDISTKILMYETNDISKLEVNHKLEQLIDINDIYYKNDTIIFAEIVNGLSPIIYKREREKDEPISVLVEKISYFKNKKTGIEKLRQIEFYENDAIETLKIELLKQDFEVNEIGEKEYLLIEKMYNRYSKY